MTPRAMTPRAIRPITKSKGFVLMTVLCLLLILGLAVLEQGRTLTSASQWQSSLFQQRARLDHRLDSALQCLAIYMRDLHHLPTAECDPGEEFMLSISPQADASQYLLSVAKGQASVSQLVQLGELPEHHAVMSRSSLPAGLIASSIGYDHSPISAYFGINSPSELVPRLVHRLEVSSPDECGQQLLESAAAGHAQLWLEGDCQIKDSHWQGLVQYSTVTPLAILITANKVWFEGEETLNGVVAIDLQQQESHSWHDFSLFTPDLHTLPTSGVMVTGKPAILGSLMLQGAEDTLFIEQQLRVDLDAGLVVQVQFALSARSWIKGQWRDW